MIAIGIVGAAIAVLILLYLTRPRFRELQLSAAQFLTDNNPTQTSRQIHLRSLLFSRPFYLQIAALILLLTALLLTQKTCRTPENDAVGVWVIIDTSASMSTAQNGTTRLAMAIEEAVAAQNYLQTLRVADDVTVCTKVATFDVAWREWTEPLTAIAHRPVGTVFAPLKNQLLAPPVTDCSFTHAVVITDQSPRDFIYDEEIALDVIWRDVSQPVDNVGITALIPSRDPLTGLIRFIDIELSAYGRPPNQSMLTITDQFGIVKQEQPIFWQGKKRTLVKFRPDDDGTYTITVTEGGAYQYDDTAVIAVPDSRQLRVDWQLADRALFDGLLAQGWREDSRTPHLRIVPVGAQLDDVPTLIVDDSYLTGREPSEQYVGYFREADALLDDLNFDVAEVIGIDGLAAAQLPDGFVQTLGDRNSQVWIAQRSEPVPAAYVPGLPIFDGENRDLNSFSTIAFFNAMRWLLREQEPPPLYTLTDDARPQPEGNRNALHLGEGDTEHVPQSYGEIEDIVSGTAVEAERPIWPFILVGMVVLIFLERLLGAWGGAKWR